MEVFERAFGAVWGCFRQDVAVLLCLMVVFGSSN
jgi:hypothetical protein